MIRITKLAALFVLALVLAAAPARADRRVVFSPLIDGPDFDAAMAFFSGHLKPRDYDTARRLKATGDYWPLGDTLDLYLREFVMLGMGDIDDDGVEERFYLVVDPGWCGPKGCALLVVRKRGEGWERVCETSVGDQFVWITDWMDKSGYRELRATYRVYWRGKACYDDDPDLRDEFRDKPELYPPPPTERIWKPIR